MAHSRTITIDHTKCGTADSATFPMLFSGTYSYLATVANGGLVQNSSGYDIGFYADAGFTTKLPWEIESWNAATGQIVAWVNLGTLTYAANKVIYLRYGDATITTDQSNRAGVWSSNFVAVYHMGVGTLSGSDSTANGNTLSLINSPTLATGKIGGAVSLTASASQQLSGGPLPSNPGVSYLAWVKPTSFANAYNTVCTNNNSGALPYQDLHVESSGKLACYVQSSTGQSVNYDGTGTYTVSTGAWCHLAMTYDTTSGLAGYVNGALDSTASPLDAMTSGQNEFQIGADSGFTRYWDGLVDEVWVLNAALPGSFVLAAYNNQSSPSTFFTVGPDIGITNSPSALLLIGD